MTVSPSQSSFSHTCSTSRFLTNKDTYFRILRCNILNGNTSLNTSKGKPRSHAFFILKNGYTAMLILEWRFNPFDFLWRVLQLIHNQVSSSSCYNSNWIFYISAVASLRKGQWQYWLWRTKVPEFKGFVPWSSHECIVVWCLNPVTCFNWGFMSCNLIQNTLI